LIKVFFRKYFELIFWVAALILLGMSDPAAATHFTLRPSKLMGINWCPGCGMGHSIAFLLHGDISNFFRAHWLGIPALVVICHRIYVLFRQQVLQQKLKFNSEAF
jgi:hypothetical protein